MSDRPKRGLDALPRAIDRYWHGGYAAAMETVQDVMAETATAAVKQGDPPDDIRRAVLDAVLTVAAAAVKVQETDCVPEAWTV
jgi:hypothetical protein